MIKRADIEGRFWDKVGETTITGCLPWLGGFFRDGYPRMSIKDKGTRMHLWALERWYGPRPAGYLACHLCEHPWCVNADHLTWGTVRQNTLTSDTPAARNIKKTHCPAGHILNGINLYRHPDGSRKCRICVNSSKKRYRARLKRLPQI